MKKILGLDIGTNSIGWALIEYDRLENNGEILGIGSRIIPMDDNLEFEQGLPITRNATRRMARGSRKGNHRYKNRRNKLVYILSKLALLPSYLQYGFETKDENGEKIKIENQFPLPEKLQSLYLQPIKRGVKHLTVKQSFQLRIQALDAEEKKQPIKNEHLGRILYQYNQKRGYSGGGSDNNATSKTTGDEYSVEFRTLKVKSIEPRFKTEKIDGSIKKGRSTIKENKKVYKVELEKTDTSEKIIGETLNEYTPESEVEVFLNKIEKSHYYNRILNENQPRIYEEPSSLYEKMRAKVIDFKQAQETKKIGKKYIPLYDIVLDETTETEKLHLDDGDNEIAREVAISDIDKKDFEVDKEVEIECRITKDGEGNIKKVEYAKPNKTNWRKKMDSIEREISLNRKENKNYFLSHYFLSKFNTDERGKWFRVKENTILRKRYKEEFDAIWDKQVELNHDLKLKVNDLELLKEVVNYLFPGKKQDELRDRAINKGFKYLIKEMLIFYQRPLKNQSHHIGICQYEKKQKVIPVSHPLYQEFRIWDQINRIYVEVRQPEGSKRKYLKKFVPGNIKVELYKTLCIQREVTFNKMEEILSEAKDGTGTFLLLPNFRMNTEKKIGEDKKNKQKYFYDAFVKGLHRAKTIKGNETLFEIQKILGKGLFDIIFGQNLIPHQSKKFFKLWKLLYDQYGNESDMDDPRVKRIESFLLNEFKTSNVSKTDEEIEILVKKLSEYKFPRKYGSVSKKAIKNILPLMQVGQELPIDHKKKIEALNAVYEENKNRFRDFSEDDEKNTGFSIAMLKDHCSEYVALNEPIDKGGWMNWAACQLMYGRHTAKLEGNIFETPSQIQPLLKEETLRNPVVEQIVNEALQVVKEIWKTKKFGINNKELEIRVELARELKNSASERKSITEMIGKNEKANKEAINEIMQIPIYDEKGKLKKLENHCDIGKSECSPKEHLPLKRIPTKNEITKYKLWKEQRFLCPYTQATIPTGKLFSEDGSATYNREHIIPKQRFFDNSNGNLVIADRQANAKKGNLTAVEFIKAYGGTTLPNGRKILEWKDYENHVKEIFKGKKLKHLLLEKIPDGFVERQIKDTQYIARKVKEKLMQVVGEKNVVTTTGGITDYLKENWGLNEAFKVITQDRFKRMAMVVGDENPNNWARWEEKEIDGIKKKVFVVKPEVWSKRLDHRHHAIDALVVAATNQGMITQLNTLHQLVQDFIVDKKEILLKEAGWDQNPNLSDEEIMEVYAKLSEEKRKIIFDNLQSLNKFDTPWTGFMADAKEKISAIVVSHKRKQKILIQKEKIEDKKTGQKKEEWKLKIRGALHQETVYGKLQLSTPEEKNISIQAAFSLSEYIVDSVVKQQIIERLEAYDGDSDEAISSLKEEKIKVSEYITDKKGITKRKDKPISKTLIHFAEKDVYRLPIEKFGEKKNVISFIDKVISENLKADLFDHLHRFCFSEKLEDKENPINEHLFSKINNLRHKKIDEDSLEEFYDSLNDNSEKEKVKNWINGKLAFAGDGLKTLNSNLKHPVNAVKVLYSKTAIVDALKPINRGYVKTASNYCMLVLEKDRVKYFVPISFFDAVNWVTKQFNLDKKNSYNFPELYDKKIEYINTIVFENFKKENPTYNNYNLLFSLQNDDLVEFVHPKTNEKLIYRVVKMTGERCYFTPHNFARQIIYKKTFKKKKTVSGNEVEVDDYKTIEEYDFDKNCSQVLFDEAQIKYLKQIQKNKQTKEAGNEVEKLEHKAIKIQEHCIPYKINRLGMKI